ncbi:MAG: lipase family protein [Lentisphaerales bacterium]|nr:lipase family protein [Lentisphaerales bacterium]
MNCFDLDFSKKAVFQPGTVAAFQHFQEGWIAGLKSSESYLVDWWAANLSQISYRSEGGIREELQDKGEFLQSFRADTQYAYLCRINGLKFLVIQGSCTFKDNVLDIKFFKKRAEEAAFHRGFLEATNKLWTDLQPVLEEDHSIILCGHSLGGAIAQIIASRTTVKCLITFGAPRVAGCEITSLIKVPYRRYINCCDGVTMLPPEKFGFRHTGKLIFINDKQDLVEQESLRMKWKQSFKYFLSLNWLRPSQALTRSLTDHSPVNYSQAIARHLIQKELEK